MKPSITPRVSDSTSAVTPGQKQQFIRFVEDAARKAAGLAVDKLSAAGLLNAKSIQQVLMKGDKLATAVTAHLMERILGLSKSILRPISIGEELTLDETDGKATLAEARDVFTGYIDPDFKTYGTNVPGVATGKMPVSVYEMVEDATFEQMFGSLTASLDDLCIPQDKIKQFVVKHRKWLRTEGYGTFFLFKAGAEFFVADVCLLDVGRLEVFFDRFSNDGVWRAEGRLRLVVPQLTPTAA